jgi:hypothetical protein
MRFFNDLLQDTGVFTSNPVEKFANFKRKVLTTYSGIFRTPSFM